MLIIRRPGDNLPDFLFVKVERLPNPESRWFRLPRLKWDAVDCTKFRHLLAMGVRPEDFHFRRLCKRLHNLLGEYHKSRWVEGVTTVIVGLPHITTIEEEAIDNPIKQDLGVPEDY